MSHLPHTLPMCPPEMITDDGFKDDEANLHDTGIDMLSLTFQSTSQHDCGETLSCDPTCPLVTGTHRALFLRKRIERINRPYPLPPMCISSTRRDWSTTEAMLPRYGTIPVAHSNAPDRVQRKEAATKSHLSSVPLCHPSLSRPPNLVERKHYTSAQCHRII